MCPQDRGCGPWATLTPRSHLLSSLLPDENSPALWRALGGLVTKLPHSFLSLLRHFPRGHWATSGDFFGFTMGCAPGVKCVEASKCPTVPKTAPQRSTPGPNVSGATVEQPRVVPYRQPPALQVMKPRWRPCSLSGDPPSGKPGTANPGSRRHRWVDSAQLETGSRAGDSWFGDFVPKLTSTLAAVVTALCVSWLQHPGSAGHRRVGALDQRTGVAD